jgi:DNA mismatch repair protein MutH
MQFTAPPLNEQELLLRCQQIAGKTLGELAVLAKEKLPNSLLRAKGWIGQLIEWHLGAHAQNLPLPDFINLGIELKTLPINAQGQPQESTFVCSAPTETSASFPSRSDRTADQTHVDAPVETTVDDLTWKTSRVYQKLKRVLWVPIEADHTIAIENRQVGNAILWSPDPKTEAILQTDWEELMEMLLLGRVNSLSAHFGVYLQIRPKAAHSRILQATIDEYGEEILAGPKGFYLRSKLTKMILAEHYC